MTDEHEPKQSDDYHDHSKQVFNVGRNGNGTVMIVIAILFFWLVTLSPMIAWLIWITVKLLGIPAP